MITTGCEGCCFLRQDDNGKGCDAQQLCELKDGQMFAPGYCRVCRSNKWASKQDEAGITNLLHRTIEENELKMDLLVLFDETVHTIENLKRTLGIDWYVKYTRNVIIVDVTGFGERKNLALQYLESREHSVPTVANSSVYHESIVEREATIRRISTKVTAPFFMTIPAGNIVSNMPLLAKTVQFVPNRVIYWSFPVMMGMTIIAPTNAHYGLFITKPYRTLTKSPESEPFSKQLVAEEAEMGMRLSWLCADCGLI